MSAATRLRVSLSLPNTTERYDNVAAAHTNTFDWLFDLQKVGLTKWLKDDKALFWISGKPGSGKSTAMKHVYERRQRYQDGSKEDHVDAHFFFSQGGSSMQKSFDGLLRSILHQILSQSDDMADVVIQAGPLPSDEGNIVWTTTELQKVFFEVVRQRTRPTRIMLFLDALDECDDNTEALARFILSAVEESTKSMSRMKICFTSRPWDVFNDHFEHVSGFKMEQKTLTDIMNYAEARAHGNRKAAEMLNSSEHAIRKAARGFLLRVVHRAEGLFLWVPLVLDYLLNDLTNGASLAELGEALAFLPSDLENLYKTTLDRVEPRFRRETYLMLEIVLRSTSFITLAGLWDALGVCLRGRSTGHNGDLKIDIDSISRRIRSRCGGLLEVFQRHSQDSYEVGQAREEGDSWVVQLMHQTVKDYLLSPSIKTFLLEPGDELQISNGHTFLALYYTAKLQRLLSPDPGSSAERELPFRYASIPVLRRSYMNNAQTVALDRSMYHLKQSELSTGVSSRPVLDSISEECFSNVAYLPFVYFPVNSRLSFAVVADLRIYVRDTLIEDMQTPHDMLERITIRKNSLYFDKRPETPEECLERMDDIASFSDGASFSDRPYLLLKRENTDYLDMMRLLLDYGADHSVVIELAHAYHITGHSRHSSDSPSSSNRWSEAARLDRSIDDCEVEGKTLFQSVFIRPLELDEELGLDEDEEKSWVGMARILLSCPNAEPNDHTVWPLHVACRLCSPDMVRLLLSAGADAERVDLSERSPGFWLSFATANSSDSSRLVAKANACRRLLRNGGANMSLRANNMPDGGTDVGSRTDEMPNGDVETNEVSNGQLAWYWIRHLLWRSCLGVRSV